jgi:hypothetical protein
MTMGPGVRFLPTPGPSLLRSALQPTLHCLRLPVQAHATFGTQSTA